MKTITFTAQDDGTFSVSRDFGTDTNYPSSSWEHAVADFVRILGELGREPSETTKFQEAA